jgi:hypothetical protein
MAALPSAPPDLYDKARYIPGQEAIQDARWSITQFIGQPRNRKRRLQSSAVRSEGHESALVIDKEI